MQAAGEWITAACEGKGRRRLPVSAQRACEMQGVCRQPGSEGSVFMMQGRCMQAVSCVVCKACRHLQGAPGPGSGQCRLARHRKQQIYKAC